MRPAGSGWHDLPRNSVSTLPRNGGNREMPCLGFYRGESRERSVLGGGRPGSGMRRSARASVHGHLRHSVLLSRPVED